MLEKAITQNPADRGQLTEQSGGAIIDDGVRNCRSTLQGSRLPPRRPIATPAFCTTIESRSHWRANGPEESRRITDRCPDAFHDRLAHRLHSGAPEIVQAALKLQSHSTSNRIPSRRRPISLTGPQDSVKVMLNEVRQTPEVRPGEIACDSRSGVAEPAAPSMPDISAAYQGNQGQHGFSVKLLEKQHAAVAWRPSEQMTTYVFYATSMEQLDKGLNRLREFMAGS
jgi:hypothetical protein